jgi:hypothetical protein
MDTEALEGQGIDRTNGETMAARSRSTAGSGAAARSVPMVSTTAPRRTSADRANERSARDSMVRRTDWGPSARGSARES